MKEQYGLYPTWQTSKQSKPLSLGDHELHLWCLPLELTKSQQRIALTLLSDIQKDKYHRRRTEKLKESYLAGRYYLLKLLGQYTDTPASEVLLSYSRLNKPYLSHQTDNIEFNFTDTSFNDTTGNKSYGLFAFCKHHQVGVDIEWLNREANFTEISNKRFSLAEQSYVTDEIGNINSRRCLAIWTRKEAFGKAIGKGINFKMNALDLASPNAYELNFTSHDDEWRLKQIQLYDDLISCVTYQGHQTLDIKAFNSINHLP